MNRAANQRIQVPDDLREVLLEFTISYLLEQPADVVHYAADYFTRLRDSRTVVQSASTLRSGDGEAAPTSPDESVISNDEGQVRSGRGEKEQVAEENAVLNDQSHDDAVNLSSTTDSANITTSNTPSLKA